jgi:hypothetical protein
MPVIQVHEALGSFEFELLGVVPREILDGIQHFDHIAIIPGRIDPRQYGDGCLDAARYVGVVRRKKYADDGRTNLIQDDIRILGVGMEFWLGDDDGKGAVIESPIEFEGDTFETVINTLRPDSVDNGTIYPVTGSYAGRHLYETPRNAIKYVCQTMSTTEIPVGFKVTNDGKLDAGPESDLFVTEPTCVIMRKGNSLGEDMFMRALESTVDMDIDMEDFATRVVMIAESDGENFATGSADLSTVAPGVNVYKDLFGNPLSLTKLVNESDTLEENADKRAEIALRDVMSPHRTLTISSHDYDIHGSFEVGDYIWFYDPDGGLIDETNEVTIRGTRINPLRLRVTESDWPITRGYTVAHRNKDGVWTDLTDYVHFEETQTSNITIGDFNRDLNAAGSVISDRAGAIIPPNNTIPGAPTWVTGSFQTTNYADSNGNPKARQKLVWNQPLNTDGTAILDGSHYELQYRLDSGSLYSQTWAAASTLTWDEMNTWDQPVEPDDTPWQTMIISWDDTSAVIHELPVGTGFDSRIRAVDRGNNAGEWSTISTWVTSEDDIPPSPPAAPVVAGSPIAIQVVHELGKESGGTFNLENDLAYLEVHYSSDEGFFPTAESLAGRIRADAGMMAAENAAVGTFTIPETEEVWVKVVAVDSGGNRSNPSPASPVTAELIDSAHISELTASKISAGELSAAIILSGSIKTAVDGQRVELSNEGLQAFDANGDLTVNISSSPSGGDYISLRGSDGETVATISDAGQGSFDTVYANNAMYLAGTSIEDRLMALPRGVIQGTSITGGPSANTGAGTTAGVVWARAVLPNVMVDRMYRIYYRIRWNPVNSATYAGVSAYYKWDGDASDTDTFMFREQRMRPNGTTADYTSGMHVFPVPAEGAGTNLHVVLYFYASAAGSHVLADANNQVIFEDVGPIIDYGTFAMPSSGGGSTPVQTYTKTYTSTWTRSYQGDGDLRISNGDMYQGRYSSTHGNQRSLIGFNDDQIRADLSGATIKKVEVRLDNTHFYNNSGGTAVLGTHNYGSAPGSWGDSRVDQGRQDFSWAKGSLKWVTVSNAFGNDFKSGAATGLALGPGNSTSLTYYSYWVGQNGSSSTRPAIRITYTK